MGSVTRLPAKDLSNRIDAGYYRPEYVANAKRLLDSSLERADLSSLVSDGRRTLYFGTSTLEEEQAPSDWVPFLTSDDLGEEGFFIETRARRRVPPSFLDDYPGGRLRAGELLVKVKGPNQTTAYIEAIPEYPVLVSGTIWGGIVRKDVVDPHYLVAALSCPYAVTARTRLRTNLNVEFLSADDLLSLELPKPASLAQRYVGDKVRQAERLRERARRYEAEFREAVTVATPSSGATTSAKTSRVAAAGLGRNLNPGAHTPERRAVRTAVRAAGGRTLEQLADVESPTVDSYAPDATYVGLDAIDSATCRLQPSTAAAEAVAGAARLLREGPAISRLRPYLNKVTYIPPKIAGGIGSTELLLVRPKLGVDGWFLYGVLNLNSSVRQLNPVATGSTHPRVDREDILELLVPWTDDHASLGTKLRTAQACYFASAALTSIATKLVEQLIDGRIAAVDLVAVQKAIEAGGHTADRSILQGLRQSDAPEAKPLIPDLDGLYALLDKPDEENDG